MAAGAVDYPLVYLSPFFEARRDEYLRLLKMVSTEAAWEGWLGFFLEAVRWQSEDARNRVERILDLQHEYTSRAETTARSKLPAHAVPFVMERVVVTAPELAAKFNCAYRTANSALETLRTLGIVAPIPDTHPQRWLAEELLQKVYEA